MALLVPLDVTASWATLSTSCQSDVVSRGSSPSSGLADDVPFRGEGASTEAAIGFWKERGLCDCVLWSGPFKDG